MRNNKNKSDQNKKSTNNSFKNNLDNNGVNKKNQNNKDISPNVIIDVWNLNDLIKKKDIDKTIKQIMIDSNKLSKKKSIFKQNISVKEFKKIMIELEQISKRLSVISSYANNLFSENSKNQEAMILKNKINEVNANIENKLLFISQRWKEFDDKNAKRIIKGLPEYSYYLKNVRKYKKHTLSDKEEKIINLKDIHGANILPTIYNLITTVFKYNIGKKEYSQSDLLKFIKSPKSDERKKAYEALLSKYDENKEVLGELYKHVVGDWQVEMKLRNYKSPITIRNKSNDLSDEVITTLLNSCRKNAKIFQKYFEKKSKILNMKNNRYNLYAPLKKEKTKTSYDDAIKIILEMFNEFNKDFYHSARRIIKEKHIHSKLQPNKYLGAYCNNPAPGVTPYIILNYNQEVEAISTLAHELGHGIHAILSEQNNFFNYDAPLPICETASIFSELLLAEKMKKENPKLSRTILARQIDGFFASIIRQAYFVIFEVEAHKMIAEHASVDDLSKKYLELLKEEFGKMEIPEIFSYEWLYIPHIYHTPFYCYAYSFGNLLSLSFYAEYKKNPAFAGKIVKFLSKGGSENPMKLVREIGFKLDDKFWQSGFDVIKKMIKEL